MKREKIKNLEKLRGEMLAGQAAEKIPGRLRGEIGCSHSVVGGRGVGHGTDEGVESDPDRRR